MLDDINMRDFEVMATGSLLLTNRIPHIEEFFQDGVHCAYYSTLDEMVEKAMEHLKVNEKRSYDECGFCHSPDGEHYNECLEGIIAHIARIFKINLMKIKIKDLDIIK